jgi:N-acetylneuraminic acid mutarotase
VIFASRQCLLSALFVCQMFYTFALANDGGESLIQLERGTQPAEVTEGPAMPSARGSHAGAILNGSVVVIASGSAWSADRTTKKFLSDTLLFEAGHWEAGPPLPHPAVEAAFAADKEHLYIVGGFTDFDKPLSDGFDLSLDRNKKLRIEPLPPLPVRHVGGAAAILDSQLFLAGGYANGTITNKVWTLDLRRANRHWVDGPPFPAEPRAYSALVAAGGQLYMLGGMVADGEAMRVFKDVFQYDPKTKRWKILGKLPTAGYCWAAVPLDKDERKLLVGGRADGVIHDDLWIVDLSNLDVRGVGRSIITQTCAPLVRIKRSTFWLIGGEPDADKHRTEKVTQIRLRD